MTNKEIVDYISIVETDSGFYWRAMSFNGRKVAIGGEPFTERSSAVSAASQLFSRAPVFDDGSDELHVFLQEAHQ